jgi:chromosome segregation ATPase
MKEKDGLSSSPKDNEDGFRVTAHRRTNSFSSFAKAYRTSKGDKSNRTSSHKLNTSSTSDTDDTQQLIAVLEHQVSEGEKARREMALEIAKLKDQLQRAEAQIALLKQANNNLHGQLLNKEKYSHPMPTIDAELSLRYVARIPPFASLLSLFAEINRQWGDG